MQATMPADRRAQTPLPIRRDLPVMRMPFDAWRLRLRTGDHHRNRAAIPLRTVSRVRDLGGWATKSIIYLRPRSSVTGDRRTWPLERQAIIDRG